MKKKISMKTIYLLAVITVGLVGLGVGSTYAVFTASATIDNPIAFTSNLSSTNEVIDTTSVSIGANETKTITLKVVNTTSSTLNYAAWYNTDLDGLAIGVSSDSSNKATGTIAKGVTKAIDIIIKNGSTNSGIIQFGVSSSVDQINLGARMKIISNVIEPDRVSTVRFISGFTENYSPNDSADDGFGNTVNLDTVHNLMVDSYDNLRYYGAEPNNYVLFNCSEYPDTGCEVWRIIGVVDNKVKLIRNQLLDDLFSWDYNVSVTGSATSANNWENSTLFTLLNKEYKDGVSVIENKTPEGSMTLDMTQMGLKNDETRNMLDYEEATLYLGGLDNMDIPAYYVYNEERDVNYSLYNATVVGKPISLPYASDYGYAADFKQCTEMLSGYSACTAYNWMSTMFSDIIDSGYNVWFMDYNVTNKENAVYLKSDYSVDYNLLTSTAGGVYPTVYLNEDVLMISGDGDGSQSNPYKLYVE